MTAPNPTVLHIPAGLGIDQSIREEHVQPGASNLYQENVRLTRQGSLEKCPGYTALSNARVGTGSRSAGLRVAGYRDCIAVSDGDQLDTYSPAMTQWSQRSRLPGCSATLTRVSSTAVSASYQNMADIAYGSSAGVYVIATIETNDETNGYNFPMVRIVDATTKKVIKSINLTQVVGTQTLLVIRACVIGNNLVVAWSSVAGGIVAARMDLSAIESGFATSVTLAATVTFGMPWAMHALSDRIAVAYHNGLGGTTRITIMTIDHTSNSLTTLASTTETTLAAAVSTIALAGSEELWMGWGYSTSGDLYASARNATTLASVIATTNVGGGFVTTGCYLASMGRTAANQVYLSASFPDVVSGWYTGVSVRLTNNAGTLVQDRRHTTLSGWVPASAPFAVNGRVYMEMAYDDTAGDIRNVVLVDITADASTTGTARNETVRPVAWLAPRANMAGVTDLCSRHIVSESSTVYTSLQLVRASAVTTSLALARYDFGSSTKHLPIVYGDNLYLTGGLLYQFDGERAYENGFIVPPRVSLSSSGTGITGTFSYVAIHEYTDAVGNVIWSSPSPVQTVTVANKTVSIYVRRPSVTWKEGYDGSTDLEPQGLRRTKTKVYRTLSTGTGDFYLLASVQSPPGAGPVTITDAAADGTISSNAKLYKTPGIVGTGKDRQAVGAVRGLTECNGVLVVIDGDGTTLRAFAERTVGEAAWHHDVLQLPIDGDGDITALASLDGSVVAFKRDAIYIVPVEPASANTSVGGFGAPRRIAVDVGCIDPRSVVVTGKGVFFQSDRGIELLTRALVVDQIGVKVQDTFADYPNVTAAVLDVKGGLVRFACAQTGSSTVGIDLVYDLVAEQWVSDDKKTGAATTAQAVSAAYAYVAGSYRYVWIDSVGTVRYENASTYLHGGSWVSGYWETPWLKLELQREHQMWQALLLFERKSACGLVAEVAYDFADYDSANTKTWTEAEITSYTRQVELRVTGRHTAVKFRFHDTAPVTLGTGQGIEFIGLSLDLAPHQGPTQGTPRIAAGARK